MTTACDFFEGRAGLLPLAGHRDARGELLPLAFDGLPFVPCRAFLVRDVPAGTERGGHAHACGQQLLLCVSGRLSVELRCTGREARCTLEPGGPGLLLHAGVWSRQTYELPGTALLALASEPFDPASYIQEPR